MKLTIHQSPEFSADEVIINCRAVTPELADIIDRVRMLDCSIGGKRDGELFRIPLENVLYFDSTDSRCFAYCTDECYEIDSTIAKLEEQYTSMAFVRISKNTIVNRRAQKARRRWSFPG